LWSKTLTGGCAKAFRYTDCYINNAAPATPTISAAVNVLTSSSATTYQWYLNGALIPGATNQTYNAIVSGVYIVRTTDINGCVNVYSDGFNFSFVTGVSENNLADGIIIYPNPTNGIVTIDPSILVGINYEVAIFDLVGKLVLKEKNVSVLDLTSFENGVYIIKLTSETAASFSKRISLIK
jgi:hypothetical protein